MTAIYAVPMLLNLHVFLLLLSHVYHLTMTVVKRFTDYAFFFLFFELLGFLDRWMCSLIGCRPAFATV